MKKLVALTVAAGLLAGCTSSDIYSGNVYTANQAKQVQSVTYGTVVSVTPVKIQTNTNANGSSSNVLGTVGGGVVGGILGSTIGGGAGRDLAAAIGAIAGAVAGNAVQNDVAQVNAVQLDIRQENGNVISVVQKDSSGQFYAGQPVKMIGSGNQINVSPR
ncbi:glycine zipper 2TM domain-containing protein [Utexia brackfieldae]|uniref:glycine zipper 2TM domain-containing protein n=1 Tax=Utexia brackfieldae TaxID=3074108 RepID=UPI00370D1E47